MINHMSKYSAYLRAGLDPWTARQLTRRFLGECDFFFEGLALGVCPREVKKIGKESWETAYRRAVNGEIKRRERDRLHNQSQALARGEVLPHEEMYPSASFPYMPQYMRRVLSHVHDPEKKVPDKISVSQETKAAFHELVK